jgi:ribonucleoside-diphosphate reductase alpha chain
MADAEVPASWSQVASDIMVSKYFRKAGVPQTDEAGNPLRDAQGQPVLGPERSARQVIGRLTGCWRHWGESHGYFASSADAAAFADELSYMLVHQMAAPNSPQWFNTGLAWAYGITGPAQGHFYVDPADGELQESQDAYTRPQPHACQPYHALVSTPRGPIPIGEIVTQNLIGLPVYDGTENGKGLTRVVAVKANGVKPVFRIVLKNGVCVEATADHLVYAVDERRTPGAWRRVDELRPGQRLQVSTQTAVTSASNDDDIAEAALVGWLQGDGFVGQYSEGTNTSLTIEFMTINEDEFAYVMERVNRVFPGVHVKMRAVESDNPDLDIRRIRLYGERLRPSSRSTSCCAEAMSWRSRARSGPSAARLRPRISPPSSRRMAPCASAGARCTAPISS